jgi:DinB family protein
MLRILTIKIPCECSPKRPRLQQLAASLCGWINKACAPGKWSPYEILCHLADCETDDAVRYRRTLANDNHIIQPFNQERWAKSYEVYTSEHAVQLFTVVRGWNLALLRSLTPEQLARAVTHPERGTMLLKTMIETAAGHDLNHLKQLEAARHAAV